MNIKIGYLVPSYNHSKYICTVLDSIYEDALSIDESWELIIIDDGSTDNSFELIKKWVAEHNGGNNIVAISRPNKGLGATLNELISKSQAELLRLCASDDLVVAGSTQFMLTPFNQRDNVLCVVGDAIVVDDDGDELHSSSIKYHGGNIEDLIQNDRVQRELILNWCIAGSSVLVKKSHYLHMTYDESSPIDDFDLFLSLLEADGNVIVINQKVCFYRVHASNTSKVKDVDKRVRNLEAFLTIIQKYEGRINNLYELPIIRYKTQAKISFLQKKYFKCFENMFMYYCKRYLP